MSDDLTAIEKRTASWRLNLADLGVVRRNTFAKATITDFQKLQNDPIKVKSMVKVQIEGQTESEYLPLWFCPKKDYWDTLDYQSQDQSGLYYKNAWMSFRVGDEVKVLLVDNIPKVVVGFADNVPRIGEDIFKTTQDAVGWFQISKIAQYTAHDKGPDGFDLGLATSCERIVVVDKSAGEAGGVFVGSYATNINPYAYNFAPGSPIGWQPWISYDGYNAWCYTNARQYLCHYLVPIGPILFVIRLNTSSGGDYYRKDVFVGHTNAPVWVPFPWGTEAKALAEAEAQAAAMAARPQPQPCPQSGSGGTSIKVCAAINNKDRLKYAQNATNPDEWPLSGFTKQVKIESLLSNTLQSLLTDIQKPDLKIKVRPHTKTELQAAGMWPFSS